jgi:choline-sulfatase
MGNVLVILSDEHSPRFMGSSGHPVVKTPNLDALAARGIRFTNAYTPSPICVPARASLATGRWVHELGNFDSAQPYRGHVRSWAHASTAAGYETASVGKLHYGAAAEDHGFGTELVPMYVANGVGWVQGLLRNPAQDYPEASQLAASVGIGESSYVAYDRVITTEATNWIQENANGFKPWVLFVSFVSPHYPLTVPEDYWNIYPGDLEPEIAPIPISHPAVKNIADFFDYHKHFDAKLASDGRRAYFGLCSFLDDQVGQVLSALQDSGTSQDTTVIYTSDHGDMAGNRGLWAKSYMYEDSVGVPMIVAGPGIASGQVSDTPVNLVDVNATVLSAIGLESNDDSLVDIARDDLTDRLTFSEYHDGGSTCGFYMVRTKSWKYVYYVGYEPQLFDTESDPDELVDLGRSEVHSDRRDWMHAELFRICEPSVINDNAFASQKDLVEQLGGPDAIANALRFNHTPVPN